VDELAEATFIAPMEGYIQRMLLVLAEQGILPGGATFDPWGPPLDRAAERARIRHVLNSLSPHRHEERKGTPRDSS
jgi:4-hydroxy-tetrahydrodipicolinate synthase